MNRAQKLVLLLATTTYATAASAIETGISYSTWYTKKAPYVWAIGHGAALPEQETNQFLTDINGDGFDDAVVYFNGSWNASLSNSQAFIYAPSWSLTGHGIGSTSQLMGDVTGVQGAGLPRSDAVVFFDGSGEWFVSEAGANGLGFPTRWKSNFGGGSDRQFLGDVGGLDGPQADGRADAVVYFRALREWSVAKSTGSTSAGFGLVTSCRPALSGLALPVSTEEFLADVDGDQRSDAVLYDMTAKRWFVAKSNGSCFDSYQYWADWSGRATPGATSRLVVPASGGDSRADVVEFFGEGTHAGEWWIHLSLDDGPNCPGCPPHFRIPEGGSAQKHGYVGPTPPQFSGRIGAVADRVFVGRPLGPSSQPTAVIFTKAVQDLSGTWRPAGEWRHLNWNNYFSPDLQNFWESKNIAYRPKLADGTYGQYDSADVAQIDYHIDALNAAAIDFVLFDITNNNFELPDGGLGSEPYIKNNALVVAQRMDARRHVTYTVGPYTWTDFFPNSVRFAVSIGRAQFVAPEIAAQAIEDEAALVLAQFKQPSFGRSYFGVAENGVVKPLLVVHATKDKIDAWKQAVANSSSNRPTNNFTVRFSQGPRTPDPTANAFGYPGGGDYIPESERGQYFGWLNYSGAELPSDSFLPTEATVVAPGYNNRRDGAADLLFHSRESGYWYWEFNWRRVVERVAKPSFVIITSFNEYLEESAIWPALTDGVDLTSAHGERWQQPYQYWSATCLWNRAYYKLLPTTPCPTANQQ